MVFSVSFFIFFVVFLLKFAENLVKIWLYIRRKFCVSYYDLLKFNIFFRENIKKIWL